MEAGTEIRGLAEGRALRDELEDLIGDRIAALERRLEELRWLKKGARAARRERRRGEREAQVLERGRQRREAEATQGGPPRQT